MVGAKFLNLKRSEKFLLNKNPKSKYLPKTQQSIAQQKQQRLFLKPFLTESRVESLNTFLIKTEKSKLNILLYSKSKMTFLHILLRISFKMQ